jgi:hypothetical protein
LLCVILGSARAAWAQCAVSWTEFGAGNSNGVLGQRRALLRLANGDLVAAGAMTFMQGASAQGVTRFDGVSWSALGLGMTVNSTFFVGALAVLPNGDILAGGNFISPALYLARWNGVTWSAFQPGGPIGNVRSVVVRGADVIVGGDFLWASHANGSNFIASGITRWNGSDWVTMPGAPTYPRTMLSLRNGDLLAAFGTVDRWDGTTWTRLGTTQLGSVNGAAYAACELDGGSIAVAGQFSSVNGVAAANVARFDGSSWSALGAGVPGVDDAIAPLPDGGLLVGQSTLNGAPTLLRWDGVAWSGISTGAGVRYVKVLLPEADGSVTTFEDGSTPLTGGITSVGRLATNCPATAVAYGSGCQGPAGTMQLQADTLPWLGNTLRTTASGYGPSSIGFMFFGTSATNVPLSAVHPAGGPGCSLLSAFDLAHLFVLPVGGRVSLSITLPHIASFAGFALFHQASQVELSSGSIVAITSSNALQLTTGFF